ncbi:hypothetical protein EPA93_47790 [Ktedonosporobacter rubrisoli]|uniref:Uncharacterized protein n=1 Tax=Ktedonosporobacter rubrisoli TaxID=2509675 RepID=A0A4P6K5I9_KTERU|nr:hypothetical protein [Ktedonosporobacter rubrisoli]QBD83262.1 hypothetical protein EPA93_47790 [Ktedonosporobacter rubrisoli]
MVTVETQAYSRYEIQGRASGILIMTLFGAGWASTADYGPILYVSIAIISLVLIISGVYMLVQARRLPKHTSIEAQKQGRSVAKRFYLVFALEVIAIFIAARSLSMFNHSELIIPVIGLVVGLHFLPLAKLFGIRLYYLSGLLLSLLAILTILAQLVGVTPGTVGTWSSIDGLGNAIILWLTSLYLLATCWHMLSYHNSL